MSTGAYPEVKINGRLLPLWIAKNFKKYKLDPIVKDPTADPCARTTADEVKELRKYQAFIASYLDYRSPFRDILIYHGLGAGKTAAAVNMYNTLFNFNPNWNVFVLIKASLKHDPWMRDLNEWLRGPDRDARMANIKFIHYDSPKADRDFIDAVKSADAMKKNIYIIEEAHNFIKNVYGNLASKEGRRALTIYEYIQREKKENDNTRVVLLSGTPAVNSPFELALIFNLMRPNLFPMSEVEFNDLYLGPNGLSEKTKNMFQRRILGLVSYYRGATTDLFAEQRLKIKNVPMDPYQEQAFSHYEFIEAQLNKKRKGKKTTSTYRSYTRQASNFVFPNLSQDINAETRPRPNKFKLTEEEAEKLLEGKSERMKTKIDPNTLRDMKKYKEVLDGYVAALVKHFKELQRKDEARGHTIKDDIDAFKKKYEFVFSRFWVEQEKKSELLLEMYRCSCKMTAAAFNMFRSKGPILFYSNYVLMEGLQIFKIYLDAMGYAPFTDKTAEDPRFKGARYIEYHGMIDQEVRAANLKVFNKKSNIHGDDIRVIMISPAGSEGISLHNVRQVHVLEPYWNEVRISQLIGRAIRQCVHADLPMEERNVDVFRYHAVRAPGGPRADTKTTDTDLYELAQKKERMIDSFLSLIRESAVDCELFKAHNMRDASYTCFKFNENSYFDAHVGPAFREDIYYDKKIDNGLNAVGSVVKKVKVIRVKAVQQLADGKYSDPADYWYNPDTGVAYDFDMDFPVGRVSKTDGIVKKTAEDHYIIDQVIDIPLADVL